MDNPPVQFAPTRGGRIAYQRFGEGTEILVGVPPAAQNIEASWDMPEIAAMLRQLGAFSDFLHFDKRGTGASDPGPTVPELDQRVDDLRAVFDHAEIESAHLFAQSEGGPLTLLFAAAYPHRVRSVTLFGSSARMAPDEYDRERQLRVREEYAEAWGTQDSPVVGMFAPSKLGDQEFVDRHRRYERLAASSAAVRDLMIQMLDWDVREVLADVRCPVLVMHRTGDVAMPLEWAKEVHELLPDSTFVELDGNDHFAYLGDQGWLDLLEEFVTGEVSQRVPPPAPAIASITTLGRFAVTSGGVEVPTSAWGSRRARTLVKRLAAARGWPVRREEIAELLWPDEPDPAVWGARLSVQLSTVRRVLGGGIIADRQTIALDLDDVDVDLVRLHSAADDESIVELHAGPFLPEEAAEEWRRGPHDEALAVARAAGHRLLTAALDRPDPERATQLAHLLLSWDEFDVIAHDGAVEAAVLAGDPAAERAARDRRAVAEA